MSYDRKNYNSLRHLNYIDQSSNVHFNSKKDYLNEGLVLNTYNINLSSKDTLLKNYTSNILTAPTNSKNILSLPIEAGTKKLLTKIGFQALSQSLSGQRYLTFEPSGNTDSILPNLNNLTGESGQQFIVDLINDDFLTISVFDGSLKKFLYRNSDTDIQFTFLSPSEITQPSLTSNYYFNYNYNEDNQYLQIFQNGKVLTEGIRVETSTTTIISSYGVTISNITSASPAVVTSNGHGFLNGDSISLNSIVGMSALNSPNLSSNRTVFVGGKTANTFQLFFNSDLNIPLDNRGVLVDGITKANPAVMTAAGHKFLAGELVLFKNVGGMTQLNNQFKFVSGAAGTDLAPGDTIGDNVTLYNDVNGTEALFALASGFGTYTTTDKATVNKFFDFIPPNAVTDTTQQANSANAAERVGSAISQVVSAFPVGLVLSGNEIGNTKKGLINIDKPLDDINLNNIDLYSFLDFENNNILSNETLSGINYNMVSYFPYEDISLSGIEIEGKSNNYYANLKYFNLKNQISQSNILHGESFVDDPLTQREYFNFTNNKNIPTSKEDLSLNYTVFNKEYEFLPNKVNEFILPSNIFPFKKINVNDTNLAKNGAFAASSPYFSDKIFKSTNLNINNLSKEFIDDEENLVTQDDLNFLMLQNDDILGFQNVNEIQKNDIFGDYLCTWLKKEGNDNIWYDRYYVPDTKSFQVSLTGQPVDQVFDNISQAEKYFNQNAVDKYYFDIISNFTFEPNAKYLYQRIGKDYVNKMLDNQSSYLKKDTFNVVLSSQTNFEENKLIFDQRGYDKFRIDDNSDKNFHVSFDLNLDSLSSLDSYNIIGNMYNDGFTLKNNFYFTPFIFVPFANQLSIFSKDFELINKITYDDVTDIIDILYNEQTNDFVLVCSDRLLKSNIFGERVGELSLANTFDITRKLRLERICNGYKSRYLYGSQNVAIFTHHYDDNQSHIYSLNLNTLAVDDLNIPFQSTSASNSVLYKQTSGFILLDGSDGNFVTDNLAYSIDSDARYISNQFIPGEAFNGTSYEVTFQDGIPAGTTFNQEFFDILLPLAGSPGSPYYPFFDFVVEGKKRILITDLDNIVSFDPIIDTTKNRIDFTSTIGEKFYIQTHTGATNGGKLKVHGSDRYPLSTFDLNGASVSGIGIDYTYEDGEFKVLSFSQDLTGNTIVDKFNTVNGRSEGTTYLNVSSNEPYSLCAFKAETAFDLTSASLGYSILSTVGFALPYNTITGSLSVKQHQRIPKADVDRLRAGSTGGTTGAGIKTFVNDNLMALSGSRSFNSFTNGTFIYNSFKDVQNNLTLQFKFKKDFDQFLTTTKWNSAGPPVLATGFTNFFWNQPQDGLSAWDGAYTNVGVTSSAALEVLYKVPNTTYRNHINLDFNFNNGTLNAYNNGLKFGSLVFEPNYFSVNDFLIPEVFVNSVNMKNKPISEIIPTSAVNYYGKGGSIENIKIYNKSVNEDLINYLNLENLEYDNLYFDMYNGTYNNIEEINSLYSYSIPGNKNNSIKIHLENITIAEENISDVIRYMQLNLEKQIPINSLNISYRVNNKDYHMMENGIVMTGAIHGENSTRVTGSSALTLQDRLPGDITPSSIETDIGGTY